jgi:arylsulfatase A-like enzyme
MSETTAKPNILVVVMDCVRASDFTEGSDAVTPMPFADELRKESVVFPRATSPCSWTIPSHASLFTGLYPWESGAHAKEDLRLRPAIPRLAEQLRPLGYHSLALSANPVLLPTFGMLQGFDHADWAAWWEPFLRTPHSPPGVSYDASEPVKEVDYDRRLGGIRRALLQLSPNLHRAPYMIDAASRLLQKIEAPDRPRDLSSVPWIERRLEAWLAQQSPSTPTFTFINLLEAHEPYLTDSVLAPTLRSWLQYAKIRQDHFSAATGHWTPSAHELVELRRYYRHMIQVIDHRLRAIVQVFKDAGRWDNTLMFLTSDHGQAFGEHGILFHTLRIDEGLTRVPLWVRYPRGVRGGETGVGWTSLIDIAPTSLKAAGAAEWKTPSGHDLERLIENPRPEPILAMGDGMIWTHVDAMLSPERREWLDRIFIAAYDRDRKVIVEARTGAASAYDIERDPAEAVDVLPAEQDRLQHLVDAASAAGRMVVRKGAPVRSQAVEDRLKSWGYV